MDQMAVADDFVQKYKVPVLVQNHNFILVLLENFFYFYDHDFTLAISLS